MPDNVRQVLVDFDEGQQDSATPRTKMKLKVQAVVAGILVFALAFHLAAVGLVGLLVIVLLTAFNGITDEHDIGFHLKSAQVGNILWGDPASMRSLRASLAGY